MKVYNTCIYQRVDGIFIVVLGILTHVKSTFHFLVSDTTIKNGSFFESSPDMSASTCNVEFTVEEIVLSDTGM